MNSIDDFVATALRDHPPAAGLDALSSTARAHLERYAARVDMRPAVYLEQQRAAHAATLAQHDAASAARALALEIRRG